ARFTLDVKMQQLKDTFSLSNSVEIIPTWNRAPGSLSPIVIKNRIGSAKWGFQPAWAKAGMSAPHNARIETAATKPYFRNAWAKRHCLVPVTGFYEWQKTATGKQPIYFDYQKQVFAFAGLWEKNANDEVTFTILTQSASGPVAAVHPRMPVVLPPALYDDWLAGQLTSMDASTSFMQDIAARPVSRAVNNARNDNSELLAENFK
ncbi:MAG: SOS response-associated peptidase, partial [Phormidesmis sp.]